MCVIISPVTVERTVRRSSRIGRGNRMEQLLEAERSPVNHPNPSSNKSSSKKSTPDLDRALGKVQRKDMFRRDGITVENISAFIASGEILLRRNSCRMIFI